MFSLEVLQRNLRRNRKFFHFFTCKLSKLIVKTKTGFECGTGFVPDLHPLEQCCGSGMFIPDPDFYPLPGSRIPDPKTATKESGEKK